MTSSSETPRPTRRVFEPVDMNVWANAFIKLHSEERKITADDPLWWAVERTFHGLRREAAEELWDFVLLVLSKKPNDFVLSCLAAGPLEDLIAYDGQKFIERIERLSRTDPAFRHLLGGVWKNQTPDDVWARVEKCQGEPW